jgi:hypothetical protein
MMPNSPRGFNFHSLVTELSARTVTQPLILGEENKLRVFDNKVPKRISGTEREKSGNR